MQRGSAARTASSTPTLPRSRNEAGRAVPRAVRVTSIVDIPDAPQSLHQYLSRSLHAMASGRTSYVDPVRIDVTFDPAASRQDHRCRNAGRHGCADVVGRALLQQSGT